MKPSRLHRTVSLPSYMFSVPYSKKSLEIKMEAYEEDFKKIEEYKSRLEGKTKNYEEVSEEVSQYFQNLDEAGIDKNIWGLKVPLDTFIRIIQSKYFPFDTTKMRIDIENGGYLEIYREQPLDISLFEELIKDSLQRIENILGDISTDLQQIEEVCWRFSDEELTIALDKVLRECEDGLKISELETRVTLNREFLKELTKFKERVISIQEELLRLKQEYGVI